MSQLLDRLAANGTTTWNGALVSNATTGFDQFGTILDYFTKAGTYRDRPQTEVDADMARIFADDEAVALKMVLGLRLITRTPHDVEEIEDAQTGFGRKDEFFKAVVWLNNNKPEILYRNLHLIPLFGCWKDLFSLPLITVLDRQKVYQLVKANLDDQLLRKYLPQIRSKNHIRTQGWSAGYMGTRIMPFPRYLGERIPPVKKCRNGPPVATANGCPKLG
ncbi:MAG: hypothetical protein R3B84_11640 [Zavarzinella sp.]